jgi:hypothetical protein
MYGTSHRRGYVGYGKKLGRQHESYGRILCEDESPCGLGVTMENRGGL